METLGRNDFTDFFKEILGDVVGDKEVKTSAIVFAVKSITGSNPIVDKSNPNQNVIKFTKKQRLRLENFLSGKKGEKIKGVPSAPSNVIIDHKSLWLPYVLKRAIPVVILLVGAGYLLGKKF